MLAVGGPPSPSSTPTSPPCAPSPGRPCPASAPPTRRSPPRSRGSARRASWSPGPSSAGSSPTFARPSLASRGWRRRRSPSWSRAGRSRSCFNRVVIPWSNTDVPGTDVLPIDRQPVYKETGYGLVGVAGESRSGDANGQWFRVLGGGGQNTISIPTSDTGPAAGVAPFAIAGAQPAKQSAAKTPFRPDVACETQDPPNLSSAPPIPEHVERVHLVHGGDYPGPRPQRAVRSDLPARRGRRPQSRRAPGARPRVLEQQFAAQMQEFVKNGLPAYQKAVSQLEGGG